MKKIIIGNSTLYNCDYREIIDEIKADAIFTDPPYDFQAKGGGIGGKRKYLSDADKLNITVGFDFSVFNGFNHIVSFCSKAQVKDFIVYAEENGYSWRQLAWHKTNPTPLTNNNYLPDTEWIFHLWKNQPLGGSYASKKGYFVTQVEKNKFSHFTVKPLKVVQPLIENMSHIGQTIFDPFAGLMTTAIAGLLTGRKVICCEINKDIFAEGCERVANIFSQGDVFSIPDSPLKQSGIF